MTFLGPMGFKTNSINQSAFAKHLHLQILAAPEENMVFYSG